MCLLLFTSAGELRGELRNEANTFHHTFIITPSLSTPHIPHPNIPSPHSLVLHSLTSPTSPFPHPLPQPPSILHSLTCMLIVVFHLLEEVSPPFPPPQLSLQVLHVVAAVVLCQQLTLQALQLSLRLHQQTHHPGETCKGVATNYRVRREQQILVETEFMIWYVGGSSKTQTLYHRLQFY